MNANNNRRLKLKFVFAKKKWSLRVERASLNWALVRSYVFCRGKKHKKLFSILVIPILFFLLYGVSRGRAGGFFFWGGVANLGFFWSRRAFSLVSY